MLWSLAFLLVAPLGNGSAAAGKHRGLPNSVGELPAVRCWGGRAAWARCCAAPDLPGCFSMLYTRSECCRSPDAAALLVSVTAEHPVLPKTTLHSVQAASIMVSCEVDIGGRHVDIKLFGFKTDAEELVEECADAAGDSDLCDSAANAGGNIALDAGAGGGAWAIRLALCRPELRVIALEPHPTRFPYLLANLDHNLEGAARSRVVAAPWGIAAEATTAVWDLCMEAWPLGCVNFIACSKLFAAIATSSDLPSTNNARRSPGRWVAVRMLPPGDVLDQVALSMEVRQTHSKPGPFVVVRLRCGGCLLELRDSMHWQSHKVALGLRLRGSISRTACPQQASDVSFREETLDNAFAQCAVALAPHSVRLCWGERDLRMYSTGVANDSKFGPELTNRFISPTFCCGDAKTLHRCFGRPGRAEEHMWLLRSLCCSAEATALAQQFQGKTETSQSLQLQAVFSAEQASLYSVEDAAAQLQLLQEVPLEMPATPDPIAGVEAQRQLWDGVSPRAGNSRVRVALVVRTYHGDLEMLLAMLNSVEIFWPRWGDVVTVFDSDSAADRTACDLLPRWARCAFQLRPRRAVFNTSSPEQAFMIWSHFYLEQHVAPGHDFVAIVCSDVVFHSFAIEELIFDWADGPTAPKPIIHGRVRELSGDYSAPVNKLFQVDPRLYWVAEFTDTFPFVVRTEDFGFCRGAFDHVLSRPGRGYHSAALAGDFDRAWAAFHNSLEHEGIFDLPSSESFLGHCFWHWRRERYSWSIQAATWIRMWQAPAFRHFTCPQARVATHVPYMDLQQVCEDFEVKVKHNSLSRDRLVTGATQLGRRPSWVGTAAFYFLRAGALMNAAICSVRWKDFKGGNRGANWARLRAHQCEGLGRAGYNISEVILSRNYPAGMWAEADTLHCGNRTVYQLLRRYHRLLDQVTFMPA